MTPGARRPRSVLLHGSCVSRDAFALEGEDRFRLEDYYARSSFASAFAPRGVEGVDLSRVESAFQRRMVERDLGKHFVRALARTRADVLVVDLASERNSLVVDARGGVATRSAEFVRAGGAELPTTKIESGSPEFLVRWEAGWSAFVAEAREHGVLDRVLVHEVRWARRSTDGTEFDHARREQVNATFDYLHARMRKDLPERRFLRVPDKHLVGDPDHRWGPGPVHLVEEYYRTFLDLLDAATSGR